MTWRTLNADERTALCEPLRASGLSARQMAERLGTTRHAIVGHYYRHLNGLGTLPKAVKLKTPNTLSGIPALKRSRKRLFALVGTLPDEMMPEPDPDVQMRSPKRKPATAVPAPEEIETPPIRFLDRKMGRECAYILDMASLTCCGRATPLEASWCSKHRQVVFGRN
jgi:hypothetical protein